MPKRAQKGSGLLICLLPPTIEKNPVCRNKQEAVVPYQSTQIPSLKLPHSDIIYVISAIWIVDECCSQLSIKNVMGICIVTKLSTCVTPFVVYLTVTLFWQFDIFSYQIYCQVRHTHTIKCLLFFTVPPIIITIMPNI